MPNTVSFHHFASSPPLPASFNVLAGGEKSSPDSWARGSEALALKLPHATRVTSAVPRATTVRTYSPGAAKGNKDRQHWPNENAPQAGASGRAHMCILKDLSKGCV